MLITFRIFRVIFSRIETVAKDSYFGLKGCNLPFRFFQLIVAGFLSNFVRRCGQDAFLCVSGQHHFIFFRIILGLD